MEEGFTCLILLERTYLSIFDPQVLNRVVNLVQLLHAFGDDILVANPVAFTGKQQTGHVYLFNGETGELD